MILYKLKASDLHSSITRAAAADDLKEMVITSTELSIISVEMISTLESITSELPDKSSEKSSGTDNTKYYKELLKDL